MVQRSYYNIDNGELLIFNQLWGIWYEKEILMN